MLPEVSLLLQQEHIRTMYGSYLDSVTKAYERLGEPQRNDWILGYWDAAKEAPKEDVLVPPDGRCMFVLPPGTPAHDRETAVHSLRVASLAVNDFEHKYFQGRELQVPLVIIGKRNDYPPSLDKLYAENNQATRNKGAITLTINNAMVVFNFDALSRTEALLEQYYPALELSRQMIADMWLVHEMNHIYRMLWQFETNPVPESLRSVQAWRSTIADEMTAIEGSIPNLYDDRQQPFPYGLASTITDDTLRAEDIFASNDFGIGLQSPVVPNDNFIIHYIVNSAVAAGIVQVIDATKRYRVKDPNFSWTRWTVDQLKQAELFRNYPEDFFITASVPRRIYEVQRI